MIGCNCDLISPDEGQVLIATYFATRGSTSIKTGKKVPIHGIVAKMDYKDHSFTKSQLRQLVRKGCIQKVRKGKMTYLLTPSGRVCALKLMNSP
jgi:hypothetical protein